MSDEELLRCLHENPRQGLALAHGRFLRSIEHVVWRMLGKDADHDDVVQQVFVKIIRHGKSIRDPEKLNAWVHAVATNVVYEELRKRETRRQMLHELPPDQAQPTLVHDVEVRDYLRRVKDALDRLPPKERSVFALAVLEGHALESVAARLGYSHTTAKRRLASARRRFTLLLARHPELLGALYRPGARALSPVGKAGPLGR